MKRDQSPESKYKTEARQAIKDFKAKESLNGAPSGAVRRMFPEVHFRAIGSPAMYTREMIVCGKKVDIYFWDIE